MILSDLPRILKNASLPEPPKNNLSTELLPDFGPTPARLFFHSAFLLLASYL
jgi:hypothetical protein